MNRSTQIMQLRIILNTQPHGLDPSEVYEIQLLLDELELPLSEVSEIMLEAGVLAYLISVKAEVTNGVSISTAKFPLRHLDQIFQTMLAVSMVK